MNHRGLLVLELWNINWLIMCVCVTQTGPEKMAAAAVDSASCSAPPLHLLHNFGGDTFYFFYFFFIPLTHSFYKPGQ